MTGVRSLSRPSVTHRLQRFIEVGGGSHASPGRTAIRSTRGVLTVVRFGGSLATVLGELVTDLRESAEQSAEAAAPIFRAGQRLRITQGPFRELEGVLQGLDGQQRAILLLDLLGRTQRLAVPIEQLRPTD